MLNPPEDTERFLRCNTHVHDWRATSVKADDANQRSRRCARLPELSSVEKCDTDRLR